MKSIGQLCERSVHIACELKSLECEVFEYCNQYAQKLLNDKDFEFYELPDLISKVVFNGGVAPDVNWSAFIKAEIKSYLVQNKLLKN